MTSSNRSELPTQYEDFEQAGELPWLDRPDADEAIEERLAAGDLSGAQAAKLRAWCAQGWITLDLTVDPALVDRVNADVAGRFAAHAGEDIEEWKVELQNLFESSAAVRELASDAAILEWCDLLLGRRCVPFQTLNVPFGSQIPPHADQVLMTTHPEGYMLAAWIALEDIQPDAGPLLLWTGSHRLPYLSAKEAGLPADGDEEARGRAYNERYYDMNRRRIEEHGLVPYRYVPRKGEVLLWHSNILHGGSPIEREGSSRRSLVVHYFAEDVWHYSDLFNRTCVLPLGR